MGKRKVLSSEEKAKLYKDMGDDPVNDEALAEIYGISLSTMKKFRNEMSMINGNLAVKHFPEFSTKEIAENAGVSLTHVEALLINCGIELKKEDKKSNKNNVSKKEVSSKNKQQKITIELVITGGPVEIVNFPETITLKVE